MKIKSLLTILALTLSLSFTYAQAILKSGIWRGVTKTATGVEIPFNFEISTVGHQTQLAVINGTERIKVTDIKYKGDSVFIRMPLFDSEFRVKQVAGNLIGRWTKNLGDKFVSMAFRAIPNTTWRFKTLQEPAFNITGRWAVPFGKAPKIDQTVGEFKQVGSKLTGTFLSTTGDYRYLEGVVNGNKLYLSCFDGGHDYLFTATIAGNKIVNGKFYAGLTSVDDWSGVKNANAKLPDAYSLTELKPGYKKLAFTFKDVNGHKVSLTDNRFKNKVVIVQILGSWCPNCMDETAYLVNYYKKFHPKGVEVIGLAYERTKDFTKSQRTVKQLQNRFNISYQLLITGYTPINNDPAKSLPMMAKVLGFPTTIIIDKKGNVRKIHTGFSGPGTGQHYTDFITEFERLTQHLLENDNPNKALNIGTDTVIRGYVKRKVDPTHQSANIRAEVQDNPVAIIDQPMQGIGSGLIIQNYTGPVDERAANYTVTGKVANGKDGLPMKGIIISTGGKELTKTNVKGTFNVLIPTGDTIMVTYPGYIPKIATINRSCDLQVTLVEKY